jgi:DnaJ-class molecular chaperone
MTSDPYKLLGLSPDATAEQIKKAYRKLVRTSHPDLHPDDTDAGNRFKAIASAYDILKDPETRARFDAGEIDGLGAERPQRQYYRDFAGAEDNIYQQRQNPDPADFFADFVRSRGAPHQSGGADFRYTLEVGFLDAVHGADTLITLPDGQGLSVKIPCGIRDGQTLRLRGKGATGFGGAPSGDALITVEVQPHSVFARDGDDILLTLPVTFDEAILGGKVAVPTIDGTVGLTIPVGSSTGRVLRLRGRGISGKGDQRVTIEVMVPQKTDDNLRDFLTTWHESNAFDPRVDLMKRAAT